VTERISLSAWAIEMLGSRVFMVVYRLVSPEHDEI